MPTEALGIRSRALAQERQNSFLGAGRLVKSPGLLSIQDGFPLPHVVGKFLREACSGSHRQKKPYCFRHDKRDELLRHDC